MWLPKEIVMGCRIPYPVGAVAGVHTLNGSFPHQNVVFFSSFQSCWRGSPLLYMYRVQIC